MKLIKLFDPIIDKNEEKAILRTMKSGFWASGAGTGQVEKFENKFKKYTDANCCVAVNSGTAALHLAFSLFDIKNKEVIIPSLSFASTAHAVIYNGGKPIFADVNKNTLCIDPDDVRKKITKKTKLIVPVHFGGMVCDLKELLNISNEFDINIVDDAAHAAGATFDRKKIGSIGDATCFSFHPVKNVAMPGGGLIALNNKNSKQEESLLKSLRWCGISNRRGFNYDIKHLGWNYYMNEFSASIGIEQLKKLDKSNKKRRKIAGKYFENITTDSKMPLMNNCSYHLYWILVTNRNKFMKKMIENNVETGIHYSPIHKMEFYNSKTKLKITEKVSKEIVSLPIHPNLTENDVDKIIKLTNKFSNI